jgi:nicotinamidase-related amidase
MVLSAAAVFGAGEAPPLEGKPALIVMDTQNAYLPYMDDDDIETAVRMINATIELFRERGLPVIRVYHTDPERGPLPDTEAFQFPDSIEIHDDDRMVVKNRPSAFVGTDLDEMLSGLGCDTVFLCGLSATGCVLATYFDAIGRDYRTFMVKNGLISHDGALTASVEQMTNAVGYGAIDYMLLNAPR